MDTYLDNVISYNSPLSSRYTNRRVFAECKQWISHLSTMAGSETVDLGTLLEAEAKRAG